MASRLLKCKLGSNCWNIFKDIKVFLFDCDGVLWKGGEVIERAVDTINFLTNMGKHVYFVTNNSTKSRSDTLKKLKKFGINSTLNHVLTSCYATAEYLKNQNNIGDVYVVGESGIFEELQEAGIRCYGMEDNDEKDISVLTKMNPSVRTVVVGLDRSINYVKISRAASYIRDYGCSFIATNTDASFPNAGGIVSGGSGCMVSAISTVAGKQPDITIGKPNGTFIDLIMKQHPDVKPENILMTGDRLDTDILFARKNKIHSLCVLTGVTSEDMIQSCKEDICPEFYSSSVSELLNICQ